MTTPPVGPTNGRYVRALRFRVLTKLYDPVVRLTTREATFKSRLVEQVAAHGGRILDVGCGTGTLTILLKQRYPDAEVVGLDGDPDVLKIARTKADAVGSQVEFCQALAHEAPFAPRAFARVVSSLFFHHLTSNDKERTLSKLLELLEPTGELHIADWGPADGLAMRIAFLGIRLLDGFETTRDSVAGQLPEMMRKAGFAEVTETGSINTVFGTMRLYRARAADAAKDSKACVPAS